MAIGDRMTCPQCGHTWFSRVDKPLLCPRPSCGIELEAFEGYSTETYECYVCSSAVQLTPRKRYRWHTKPGSPEMCGGSGKVVKEPNDVASV